MIDVAQRRQMDDIEHALAARMPKTQGLTHCAQPECGEPISALRQEMGARLCMDCASAREQGAQRWLPRAAR